MTHNEEQRQDLLRRAFVNLTSVRENLGPGYVTEATHFSMYNKALDHLQQAGEDVSEWRLSHKAQYDGIDSSEIKALIDSILRYFQIKQSKTPIGFRK